MNTLLRGMLWPLLQHQGILTLKCKFRGFAALMGEISPKGTRMIWRFDN